jgi:voltage-gated potassium channel
VSRTDTSPTTTDDPHASERAARLASWETRINPWIIVSAILPLIAAFGPNDEGPVRSVINVACWLVFLADLLVHMWLRPRYLRSGRGVFDLTIVIITAPWFLITGGGSQFVVVARLARLGRVVMAGTRSEKLRTLVQQLGSVAVYAFGLLLACALIEKLVEPPSSGFTTYGDAIWWGFVTLTTVGYGDITPVTSAGRTVAVVLMLGGVAFLGTLAGTLAAFFGVGDPSPTPAVAYGDSGSASSSDGDDSALPSADGVSPVAGDVATELAALRASVASLAAKLETTQPPG